MPLLIEIRSGGTVIFLNTGRETYDDLVISDFVEQGYLCPKASVFQRDPTKQRYETRCASV